MIINRDHILGEGETSIVYECTYHNRKCAIKIFDEIDSGLEASNINDIVQMGFKRVVPLLGRSRYQKKSCLIFELMKCTLEDWHLEENHTSQERLSMVRAVLDLYREFVIHTNLVHRDIKMSNIYLSIDNQLLLGDFGRVDDNSLGYRSDLRSLGNIIISLMPEIELPPLIGKYSIKIDAIQYIDMIK